MTTYASQTITAKPTDSIDVRGPRFAATLTTLVFVVALLVPTPWAVGLLAIQAVVFAIGVFKGVTATPYAWVFRTIIRPRLGAPSEWEDPAPPRFAQAVGLGFVLAALAAFAASAPTVALVLVGFALAAALLNAVFGFCLGCEMYLLGTRALTR